PGEGAGADGAEGRRRPQRLGAGDGAVRLARHQERQGTGGAGGPDAGAVQQRPERAGARDQQGGPPARAPLDRGARLAVATLAARQRLEPVVSAALRCGQQARPEGGERGPGPQAADRVVAVRGAGGAAGKRPGKGWAAAGRFHGAAARPAGGSGAGVRRGGGSRTAAQNPGGKGGAVAAAEAEEAWSVRAAVVPPGDPVEAPFVRWVGSH